MYTSGDGLQSDGLTSSCSLVGSGDLSGTSSPSGSSYGSSSTIVWYILSKCKIQTIWYEVWTKKSLVNFNYM